MTRVLLAEDDSAISEPLARALKREGYEVEAVADGPAALSRGKAEPDLIILDLGLPGLDGLEVCRQLRVAGVGVPVLILTARADEVDTVVGLDAGADDYVTKPFRLAELLARARALLRRTPSDDDAAEDQTGLRVDVERRQAWLGDTELALTTKEFDILRVLVGAEGKVVSREKLMREIWDTGWFGSTKALDVHISVLRKKLSEDSADWQYIKTIRGVGFRFDAGPS